LDGGLVPDKTPGQGPSTISTGTLSLNAFKSIIYKAYLM
jgi:hypothetical protein